jgi:DNA helicase HerA-like ATPase
MQMAVDRLPPLVLGWALTKGMDPEYWLRPGAAPGDHSPSDVVTVPAETIANHTVIIAQSGSGKSFFLGRLIEEIMLKTPSRMLILDPNSDFRKLSSVVSPEWWTKKSKYDPIKRQGFLPDERTREDFETKWAHVRKAMVIRSMHRRSDEDIHGLQFNWLHLAIDLLSDDLSPELRNQLRHCHSLVHALVELILLTKGRAADVIDPLDTAREFFEETRDLNKEEFALYLQRNYGIGAEGTLSESRVLEQRAGRYVVFTFRPIEGLLSDKTRLRERIDQLQRRIMVYRRFVLEPAERFYFSEAHAIKESGLLGSAMESILEPGHDRLQVVDLPSIRNPRYRRVVVSTFVEAEWLFARKEWERALDKERDKDTRVPTFIVVDEAHNIISADTNEHKAIREQFRTIASEGRKFGLYLILVSQRPDKLDPLVLSECENRAIMRVGAEAVLQKTNELLGIGSAAKRATERCLEFDTGRALLIGAWAGDVPKPLYTAARRTEEGGRSLQVDHWAKNIQAAPESPSAPVDRAAPPKPPPG